MRIFRSEDPTLWESHASVVPYSGGWAIWAGVDCNLLGADAAHSMHAASIPRPSARTPEKPPPVCYDWTFPGAPVRVHLRLDAVTRLQEYLANAAGSPAGKAQERRGLLFGGISAAGTEIIDFQPVVLQRAGSARSAGYSVAIREFRGGYSRRRLLPGRERGREAAAGRGRPGIG